MLIALDLRNMISTILIGSLIMFAGFVIDEHTLVPLGSALAIGSGLWWLGRKLQALEDGQASIQKRLDSLPCEKNGCTMKNHQG